MNDQVEEGKAKAAGIVGILIGVIALIELICGFIYLSKGGPEGSGLWSGVGVFSTIIFSISTVFSEISFLRFISKGRLIIYVDGRIPYLHTTIGYQCHLRNQFHTVIVIVGDLVGQRSAFRDFQFLTCLSP